MLKEARVIVTSNYESMDPSKPKDTGTLVSQIWDDVRQLKCQSNMAARTGAGPPRSWASIAAINTTFTSTPSTFKPVPAVKPTAQRLREVKIKFPDLMERSNVSGMSNKAILENINSHFLTPRAAGIKRLPSGDIVVQASTENDRKSLIANQKWLSGLGSTGTVLTERFPIFVHAVHVTSYGYSSLIPSTMAR